MASIYLAFNRKINEEWVQKKFLRKGLVSKFLVGTISAFLQQPSNVLTGTIIVIDETLLPGSTTEVKLALLEQQTRPYPQVQFIIQFLNPPKGLSIRLATHLHESHDLTSLLELVTILSSKSKH